MHYDKLIVDRQGIKTIEISNPITKFINISTGYPLKKLILYIQYNISNISIF